MAENVQKIADFAPHPWLRGAHLQSVLPSLPLRRPFVERRARSLLASSRELLLDCGDGVRLQGFHTPVSPRIAATTGAAQRLLVVLVHGWEGSARSLYVLSLAQSLHEAGHEIVRLNLRDHGDTHHLNRELFHSCRLPEVIGALRRLQWLFPGRRLALAGFSLGGNFMLRAAAAAPAEGLDVACAVGVSPVLDPATSLRALDEGPALYRRYFISKWTRSLARKHVLWPGEFDFAELRTARDLRSMTERLLLRYAGYPDLESYFRGYAITEDRLAKLAVPATIVTALDDPIIPAVDLVRLARPSTLRVIATETGGHCGFFESPWRGGWIDRFVRHEFELVRQRGA
jgi:predicted alpha/beta-fold hydrolase